MTAKLTRGRAAAGVLLGGALLCGLIFAAGQLHQLHHAFPAAAPVCTNEDRVAYLKSWGWEVAPSAVETLDLVLPPAEDEALLGYNTLQLRQGMDLTPCCGQHVMRYTYTVLNHPKQPEGVQANLYLSGETVVAGDIQSREGQGFLAGLPYPGS